MPCDADGCEYKLIPLCIDIDRAFHKEFSISRRVDGVKSYVDLTGHTAAIDIFATEDDVGVNAPILRLREAAAGTGSPPYGGDITLFGAVANNLHIDIPEAVAEGLAELEDGVGDLKLTDALGIPLFAGKTYFRFVVTIRKTITRT